MIMRDLEWAEANCYRVVVHIMGILLEVVKLPAVWPQLGMYRRNLGPKLIVTLILH